MALEGVGFVHHELMGVPMFLDGPDGSPRDAVHLLYAGEKVKATYHAAAPSVTTDDSIEAYRLLRLEALVTMKLTSFRRKDQVHLLDMIEVGILNKSWLGRLQPELAERLQ